MFKKIIQTIRRLSIRPVPIDPSRYDDPVARTTSFSPAKSGGASFGTHKLVEAAAHRFEFRASLGARIFYLAFLLIGIVVIIGVSYQLTTKETISFSVDTVLPFVIGGVFTVAGGFLYYFGTQPIVFDKHSGHFWKGRADPNLAFNKDSIKTWTQLEHIRVLQLICEYCSGNKSSYYSYELNLVLNDGERINVVDHGNLKKIRDDANTLSDFLAKPLWDAT